MFRDSPDKSQKLETASFFTCGSRGFYTMELSLALKSTSATVNVDKNDMWSICSVAEIKHTTQIVLF